MIIQQINELTQLIKRRSASQAQAQQLQTLNSIVDMVGMLKTSCNQLGDGLKVASYLRSDQREVLHAQVIETRQNLTLIVQSFAEHKYDQAKPLKQAQSAVNDLHNDLHIAWTEYIQTQLAEKQALADLIAPILPADRAISLNSAYAAAERHKNNLPINATQVEAFQHACTDFAHAVDREMPETLSPVVRHFLERVKENRATLNDVNAEVLAWANDHQLLDKFAVQIGQK